MYNYKGKVAVVTGSAGGIGRATALEFAKSGAKVVCADVNMSENAETVSMIEKVGGQAISVNTDVSDEHQCNSLMEMAAKEYGGIDILFNNAGIAGNRVFTGNMSTEEWMKVIGINLNGVFFCTRAAIPHLLKNGGVIVNTASVDGLVGMGSISHYVAAKHGVIGLTKSTALEYTPQGIRCLAICPGYIKTAMTEEAFSPEEGQALTGLVPMRRPAHPSEVADFVAYACSDKATYLSGSFHVVDGGLLSGFEMPG